MRRIACTRHKTKTRLRASAIECMCVRVIQLQYCTPYKERSKTRSLTGEERRKERKEDASLGKGDGRRGKERKKGGGGGGWCCLLMGLSAVPSFLPPDVGRVISGPKGNGESRKGETKGGGSTKSYLHTAPYYFRGERGNGGGGYFSCSRSLTFLLLLLPPKRANIFAPPSLASSDPSLLLCLSEHERKWENENKKRERNDG